MVTTRSNLLSLEQVCDIRRKIDCSELKMEDLSQEERQAGYSFDDDWLEPAGFNYRCLNITTLDPGGVARNYSYLRRPHQNDSGSDYLSLSGIGRTEYHGTFLLTTTDREDDFKFQAVLQRVIKSSLDDDYCGMSSPPYIQRKSADPLFYKFAHQVGRFGQKVEIGGLVGTIIGGLFSFFGGDNRLLWTGLGTLGGGIVLENAGFYGAELSEKVARKMACRTFRKEYLPRAVHSSTPYDFNIIQKVL